MKKHINISLVFLATFFFAFADSVAVKDDANKKEEESFIVPKKKKKMGTKKLQEKLVEVFGDQAKRAPSIHKIVAHVQSEVLKEISNYLENDKGGIVLKLKKEKADSMLALAKKFENKMKAFCVDCKRYVNALRACK